jgi:hypothetical protein
MLKNILLNIIVLLLKSIKCVVHIILKSIKCVMHKSEFIPCKADALDSKFRKKTKKIAQKTLQGTVNLYKCAVPSTTSLQ